MIFVINGYDIIPSFIHKPNWIKFKINLSNHPMIIPISKFVPLHYTKAMAEYKLIMPKMGESIAEATII